MIEDTPSREHLAQEPGVAHANAHVLRFDALTLFGVFVESGFAMLRETVL